MWKFDSHRWFGVHHLLRGGAVLLEHQTDSRDTDLMGFDYFESLSDRELLRHYVLDKLVVEQEFDDLLGARVLAKSARILNLKQLGHVVGLSQHAMLSETELSEHQVALIDGRLKDYRIPFGSEIGDWIAYRKSVDEHFRFPFSLRGNVLEESGARQRNLAVRVSKEFVRQNLRDHGCLAYMVSKLRAAI